MRTQLFLVSVAILFFQVYPEHDFVDKVIRAIALCLGAQSFVLGLCIAITESLEGRRKND